ncbi:hypothetical protein H7H37_18575, partial [Mycolicibacterium insubricum]|nr:hypothetical protein [Mycolicibacterium insubricum]
MGTSTGNCRSSGRACAGVISTIRTCCLCRPWASVRVRVHPGVAHPVRAREAAVDVSDPTDPTVLWSAPAGLGSHGMDFSPDGETMYMATLAGL